jgi:putative Ca2+/H+ antiporter (TMEM165/GDT1 family)
LNDLIAIFVSVFLAELGDKTQLATLLFAGTSHRSPFLIFCAAGGALVLSTAIAVVVGQAVHAYLSALPLKLIAGLGFIAIGGWMVFQHFHGATA